MVLHRLIDQLQFGFVDLGNARVRCSAPGWVVRGFRLAGVHPDQLLPLFAARVELGQRLNGRHITPLCRERALVPLDGARLVRELVFVDLRQPMVNPDSLGGCFEPASDALQDPYQVGMASRQLVHARELFQNHRLVCHVRKCTLERLGRGLQVADAIGVQPGHPIQGKRAHRRICRQHRFALEHRDQIVVPLMRRVQPLERQNGGGRARIGLECRLIQLGRRVIVALVSLEQARALGQHRGAMPAIGGQYLRRALIGFLQRIPGFGGELRALDRAQRGGIRFVQLERGLVRVPGLALEPELLVQDARFFERDQRLLGGVRGRPQLGVEQRQGCENCPAWSNARRAPKIDGR